jgi:hypothetical protein
LSHVWWDRGKKQQNSNLNSLFVIQKYFQMLFSLYLVQFEIDLVDEVLSKGFAT